MTTKSKALQQIDGILRKSGNKGKDKGGGAHKYGRQLKSPAMARYRSEERWALNQQRRVRRHLRRLPGDRQARAWLAEHGDSWSRSFLAALPAVA